MNDLDWLLDSMKSTLFDVVQVIKTTDFIEFIKCLHSSACSFST